MPNYFQNLIHDFLTSHQSKAAAGTIKNYHYYLNRLHQWGNFNHPKELTPARIEAFRQHLQNSRNAKGELIKASTQNYHLIALRSFLKFLNNRGVSFTKLDHVKLNKTQHHTLALPGKAALEQLLASPLQTKNPGIIQKRDKAILELIITTGLKVAEVAELKKNQINFFDNKITVKISPNKLRTVPLTNQTKIWLKQYLDMRKDLIPALFVRHDKAKQKQLTSVAKDDYRLTPRTIQRIIKKYTKSAELDPSITPETLRHAYANQLYDRGHNLKSIQSALGHASASTTKLFVKPKEN